MEWASLTWTEVRDAVARGRALALLPVGATEAHGPHLPLDTDVAIARAVAARAATALAAEGWEPLVLPPVAYAVTRCAAEFPGTIGIDEEAARRAFEGIFASLARAGVRLLAVVNHHLEPGHRAVLRAAAEAAPAPLRVVFPDHARRRYAGRLGVEFAGGDAHAGRYETSLALACGAAVREAARAALEPRPLGLVAALRAGKVSFREMGAGEAYFGDPRAGTREEGERLLKALAAIVVESVREAQADAR